MGDGNTISKETRDAIQEALEDILEEGMGFICIVFNTKTGCADVFSNAQPRIMVMHLLSAAMSVVEDSSVDERADVIH